MKKIYCFMIALSFPMITQAFCGFYVARAGSQLFNQASQVVMVRDQNRTVLTMSNDFKGDSSEFAIVIPVPTFLHRKQIHITNNAIIKHLDHYSAPRLVEYYDSDPCRMVLYESTAMSRKMKSMEPSRKKAKSLGVTIEAAYTIGEYDILILSAQQSDGLVSWLKQNDYKIPEGAEAIIGSYLKQGMHFFVAKVNLKEQARLGFTSLRPIQVAYESPKFMLPIRLGMVNANGKQELYVYMLTRKGRVETTNYRTVKLPSGTELPEFIKTDFAVFYQDMFNQQQEKENHRAVFLEYAWDMNWCDPCAADPLSVAELKELGVFWSASESQRPFPGIRKPRQTRNAFITRLHVRYDAEHFPEDLFFQETGNRENFQARYVIRHPWRGKATCSAAENYLQKILPERQNREAEQLARLTGWNINEIRGKIPGLVNIKTEPKKAWWQQLWED